MLGARSLGPNSFSDSPPLSNAGQANVSRCLRRPFGSSNTISFLRRFRSRFESSKPKHKDSAACMLLAESTQCSKATARHEVYAFVKPARSPSLPLALGLQPCSQQGWVGVSALELDEGLQPGVLGCLACLRSRRPKRRIIVMMLDFTRKPLVIHKISKSSNFEPVLRHYWTKEMAFREGANLVASQLW